MVRASAAGCVMGYGRLDFGRHVGRHLEFDQQPVLPATLQDITFCVSKKLLSRRKVQAVCSSLTYAWLMGFERS